MTETSASNSSNGSLSSEVPLQAVDIDDGKESKQLEITRESTKRRLQHYLSAHDAAKPIDIEFVDMRARVATAPGSKETKEILHGVSGVIKSGEFLALMGPSGAGKSSLLNVLGARFEGEEYTGQVIVNGKPRTKELKRKIGYVLQNDVILPNLTVRETLDITARLRLPKTMTKNEKMERVDDVIHVMGLNTCEDTLVQLCSGGEKKRISIANELLVNPSVLFLANGSVVYFGAISEATNYFSQCGHPCPMHYNPADFILELVSSSFESKDQDLKAQEKIRDDLIEMWKQKIETEEKEKEKEKDNSKNNDKNYNSDSSTGKNKKENSNDNTTNEAKWQTNWIEQFIILLERAFKHRKGHILSFLTAFEICSICILSGALWWQTPTNESTLQSWIGAAFFIQIYLSFTIMFRGVVHFPTEKIVIKRERQSGSYRLSSYYLSKLMAETPIDILLPLIAVSIYYWMIGFSNNFGTYILYMLVSCLGIVSGNAFGTFLGCAMANFERALTSLAVIGIFFMLISGFLVKDRAMPIFIGWLRVTSQMRYSFMLSLLVLLDVNKFECASPDTEFEICEPDNPQYTGYINNKELLDFWGTNDTVLDSIIILICQAIVWHFLAYWSLRRSTI